MTNKIHKLEEELGELKETHQRELICMQQEMNQQRLQFDQILLGLRSEVRELRAFKSSVDAHCKQNESAPSFIKAAVSIPEY